MFNKKLVSSMILTATMAGGFATNAMAASAMVGSTPDHAGGVITFAGAISSGSCSVEVITNEGNEIVNFGNIDGSGKQGLFTDAMQKIEFVLTDGSGGNCDTSDGSTFRVSGAQESATTDSTTGGSVFGTDSAVTGVVLSKSSTPSSGSGFVSDHEVSIAAGDFSTTQPYDIYAFPWSASPGDHGSLDAKVRYDFVIL
ncbi:hypothetical protein M9194_09285 [Vibrio sp. S4M6]|uniref:hypothetical protein n=1 Tax=Vibrio sinus TaxID=2946865 RepID=UPI00202A81A8|nr:hypothetical protein [Vibrio sinus]MCL9781617.1 hypothetical protein [Vibrio sinus]